MTICCEHNRCPQKPRWFLRRFQARPWRCPQCGRIWITQARYSWADFDGWEWRDVTPHEAMAQQWLDEEGRLNG